MKFTEDSRSFIHEWHMGRGEPRPTHPKLMHYNSRRTAHLLKLSQVASIAEDNKLVITLEHAKEALAWLLEAEEEMQSIFKTMASGGDSSIIEEAHHFLIQIYVRDGRKPVKPARLNAFLMARTDAYKVRSIVEVMERAGMMRVGPNQGYIPLVGGVE